MAWSQSFSSACDGVRVVAEPYHAKGGGRGCGGGGGGGSGGSGV